MKFSKVFLVGLPGSGKTTLGKKIAKEYDLRFIDLDQEIINAENQTISSLFESKGEGYFRKQERDHLRNVIDTYSNFVLATGGGTPCFFDNMMLMNKSGLTIHLDTPIEVIQERLKNDSSRPLLKKYDLHELYESRTKWYEKAQKSIMSTSELEKLLN